MLVYWQGVAPFQPKANRTFIHTDDQPERESSVHFLERNVVSFVGGLSNVSIAFCYDVLVSLGRWLAPVA